VISRLHITPVVFIVGVVWLGLLAIDGVAVELRWLGGLTSVIPILLVLLAVFDKWLWKWSWLRGWFTDRPLLCGTWQVTLQTEWVDPKTGTTPAPILCYMAVRQSFSALSMRLMTSESPSTLIAHGILRSGDGLYRVAGVYVNEPPVERRGGSSDRRSEVHHGAFLLDVHGTPPESLKGHYWTDRLTRGSMHLRGVRRRAYSTFEEAHAAFTASPACPASVPPTSV